MKLNLHYILISVIAVLWFIRTSLSCIHLLRASADELPLHPLQIILSTPETTWNEIEIYSPGELEEAL